MAIAFPALKFDDTHDPCPFKECVADEVLLDALRRIPAFSTGCPFPKGSDSDVTLLKVLNAIPEADLPRLKGLLSQNAIHLQARLGIDGGSWDSVLVGCIPGMASGLEKAVVQPQLAKLLKEGTKAVHAAAEKTHFVREFIKGRCERESYAMMIKDLYYVYAALEVAAERCASDPIFAPLHHPRELGRTPALESDMAYLFGPQWRTDPRCVPSAAARAYAARLAHVAAHSPELMVAHSYTRYMGDLSGGRVLMRIARRMLELPAGSDDGVRFYLFERIPEPKAFKTHYRQALNSLCVPEDLATKIVDEANHAFHLNIGLFRELDTINGHEEALTPPAHVAEDDADEPVVDGKPTSGAASTANVAAASAAGCPFAKYAAQSGSPSLTCQRFAAAERQRTNSLSFKARLLSWLRPTSYELALLQVLVVSLCMAVLLSSTCMAEWHRAQAGSAPALPVPLAPRKPPFWRSLQVLVSLVANE